MLMKSHIVPSVLVAVLLLMISNAVDAQDTVSSVRAPRVGVGRVFGGEEDPRLAVAADTVADAVELNLRLLGGYEVTRLVVPDIPVNDVSGQIAWASDTADSEQQDYVVFGTARTEGAEILIRLSVYDRAEDAVTLERSESVASIFDLFDAADAVTTAALEAFSGEIIVFGTILFDPEPPATYSVYIDDVRIGEDVREQRVLAGSRRVEIRQERMLSTAAIHTETVQVQEADRPTVRFFIPHLLPAEEEALQVRESEIRELWDRAAGQSRVETLLDELDELLVRTDYSPQLEETRNYYVELREAYEARVAEGFPFTPSLARLQENYGYGPPDLFTPDLRGGLRVLRGAGPWRAEFGAGYVPFVTYNRFDEYPSYLDDHTSSGYTAKMRIEYGRPTAWFHYFFEGAYAEHETSTQIVDGPLDTFMQYDHALTTTAFAAGTGISREVINRVTALAELSVGVGVADRAIRLGDQAGSLEFESSTGAGPFLKTAVGSRVQVSPRFALTATADFLFAGPIMQINVVAGISTQLGRAHRRYDRFVDGSTESRADAARRLMYTPDIGGQSREAAIRLVQLYAAAGDESTAVRVHRENVAGGPREAETLLAIADLAYRQERFRDAYDLYRDALLPAENDRRYEHLVYAGLARSAFELDEAERVREYYDRLDALDPELAAEFGYLTTARLDDEDDELVQFRRVVRVPRLVAGTGGEER